LRHALAAAKASGSSAPRRVARDQPLLRGQLTAQERSLLPRGFDVTRLRDVRICNVVITSYNGSRDDDLAGHLDRAIVLLRKAC
jgi:hypothetical protein